MTKARKEQVSLESTPFYHCYVRCVRRAYLCGTDASTGESYEHRKQWIVSRLKFLSYVYAIDICAYAVMSNHYHVVLHVDRARASTWTKEEVVERWLQLFNGNLLIKRWFKEPKSLDKATLEKVDEIIEEWRERLCSISWFMRGVNETIARMANEEEKCKGRFWEGRFKSQALLDEAALLSCMAYVDLNPVRAGMEQDIVDSDFTSIQQRLYEHVEHCTVRNSEEQKVVEKVEKQQTLKADLGLLEQPEVPLMPFCGSSHVSIHSALPFTRQDYFALVDATGRIIRNDKRGHIPPEIPAIVTRFGINPDKWLNHVQHFGRRYGCCAGAVEKMRAYAQVFKRKWGRGQGVSGELYLGGS